MAKRLQLRRGTTEENNAFKGALGELTYDTNNNQVRVHNGVTAGGTPLATVSEVTNLVRLATETTAGNAQIATETTAGNAQIATTAIAQAGTNDTDIITAKKLRDALNATGDAPIFACRAWVSFDASTGVINNLVGGNIASVSRYIGGMYKITFTTAMLNDNYAILCSHGGASGSIRITQRTTQFCTINTLNTSNTLSDTDFISVGVFCK